ncbi:hypothetical protein GCM10010377_79290 [Streptomyces viridiviolaceus]|uniref:Uncharacterized protein n=1 Tax=Streptomyces viridiviolaceus TaxID=68282 RepID=A0ABW2E522_9ACTN|nr:hypothetical protein [Streptomyces viridiviolaceus]GHB77091.1 hypothetical protein GCM10010377_79290 [Streptomyces viridiviolaceus]
MAVTRVWLGTLTGHGEGDPGSSSAIALTINENGDDKFYGHFSRRRGDGDAHLFEGFRLNSDLISNLSPTNLTNSSIRMHITGDDAWRPERAFVWVEQDSGPPVFPLAIRMNFPDKMSTDPNEGRASVPLPLVQFGTPGTTINGVAMLLSTLGAIDSGTNDRIRLQISKSDGTPVVDFESDDTEQEDLETGQANWYFAGLLPPVDGFTKNDLDEQSITLSITGRDAWQPQSFFLFGFNVRNETDTPTQVVPLVGIRNWRIGEMSRDVSEGTPSILLPLIPSL